MTEDESSRLLPDLPRLPAEKLHAFALHWNYDGGLEPLARLIRLRQCELATAKLIYWRLDPTWYLQFKTRGQVPAHAQEGFDLIQEIERRVRDGAYREGALTFDPAREELRGGKVVNWTSRHLELEDTFVRDLPGEMYQPSGPGATPRPAGRPKFSEAERARARRELAERERKAQQRQKDLKERIAAVETAKKQRGR
jgi:hypothetical protein